MTYKKCCRMLPLSRSDGNTFIPVNSCLLAYAKESNLIRHICNIVKRTIAGKRIALAQSKVAEAMLTLLDTAVFSGLSADYEVITHQNYTYDLDLVLS